MARLAREPLAADKVLELGLQIAEALDRAHRSGIVHRDLKPGNIMLTREGVKLLDFGLAKLSDLGQKPGSGSLPGLTGAGITAMPTETPATPLTQEGTILGTFQYMSPEQLEGKEADTRSDIFALGSVLYEMATSRKAFAGDSQASLIASIMSSEPRPISEVQGMSPPALDRVVKTCLAKDPEKRWQTAHDVALQLEWIAEGGSQAGVPAPVAARRRHRERLAWVVAAVGIAASVALGALTVLNKTEPDTQVLRYRIPVPENLVGFSHPQISPDGLMIAFLAADSTGTGSIWIQRLNALDPQPLPGTTDAQRPFWSPDSRHLAYFTSQGKLKKVNVAGGPPQTIGEQAGASDGSWGSNGIILFDLSANDSVMAIPAKGGVPYAASVIARQDGETGAAWPYFLPDGKHFLFMGMSTDQDNLTLRIGELGSMESRVLGQVTSRMEYSPPGYLLFVKEGTLLAQPFDAGKGEFTGEPVPVAENVSAGGANFQGRYSVSQTGILTYWVGRGASANRLVWVDRKGAELEQIGDPGPYSVAVPSPDAKSLLVGILDTRTNTDDLWIRDLERGTMSRFTFDPADEDAGVWSPDGTRIIFSSDRSGPNDLYIKESNGVGDPAVFRHSTLPYFVNDWSRDGQWIFLTKYVASGGRLDVLAVPASGEGDSVVIANSPFHEGAVHVSPDGRWVAYQSLESGQWEVYVQAFPEPRGKWQVSTQGGSNVQWRDDGKEIFYVAPDSRIMAVEVSGETTFRAGVPQPLFRAQLAGDSFSAQRYAVVDNGQRFLLRTGAGAGFTPPITVVKNWAAELQER
jgi:Tol biopolymer transport system component